VVKGCFQRLLLLLKVSRFDFVFIHREAAPVGPPVIEWVIGCIFKKKIVYDFDDAIWMTDKHQENPLEKMIRWRSKVKSICRWSYQVSCGNQFLCDYALQFNKNVILNPTTIDTLAVHQRSRYAEVKNNEKITIGWTGSHSTVKYLKRLEHVFQHLQKQFPHFQLLVIGNTEPGLNLPSLIYKPWSVASEIKDLLTVDIGIMPLPDDEWSKGKCGFKALQYMALEIPAVASPVGVNSTIISDKVNGFLCSSDQEWIETLELLMLDAGLRSRIGKEGRKTVEARYSVVSNTSNFLALFE